MNSEDTVLLKTKINRLQNESARKDREIDSLKKELIAVYEKEIDDNIDVLLEKAHARSDAWVDDDDWDELLYPSDRS